MTLLINMWSKKYNYLTYLYGFFVLNCSLFVYTGLVWLVKIIIADRGLDWFERDEPNNQQQPPIPENPIEEVKYPFKIYKLPSTCRIFNRLMEMNQVMNLMNQKMIIKWTKIVGSRFTKMIKQKKIQSGHAFWD